MKKIFIAVLTVLSLSRTLACINGETKVLKDGTFLYEDAEGNVPYGHNFYIDEFEKGIKQLDSLYQATKDIDYLSDKGILLKRYDDAINLYLEIEKEQPNRYSTASNIGTAYELTGQNEQALKWIKRSVEIDSQSHKNSEWIHLRILEAKIKGEQFYNTRFLLGTDFGSALNPISTKSGADLKKMSTELYYQLNERISFVNPKEKIVAQLLFDLGNIAFLLGNYYEALEDYRLAKEYGFTEPLMEERVNEAGRLLKSDREINADLVDNERPSSYLLYGLSGLGLLFSMTLIIVVYKRKRKNK